MTVHEPRPRCQKADILELDDEMTGGTIVESLRALHFTKRSSRRIKIDAGVRDFICNALDTKVARGPILPS
jgi:hypothetical protein